ncbi:MAG: AAA family ATPase [Cyanobacteria bacterium J06633_8]
MISIQGYYIKEQLYNGSRTVVYRAVREYDQKPVVIKLLKNSYPSFKELLQFRNQYTIAKNLDIPGIVHPYSFESYQNSYALVMEDFAGISLREYMQTTDKSVVDVLSILLQVSSILHNIHQKCVIHKDIKPANILINPETKQVKLIDFSIASLLPKETQEIKNPNGLEGTLAYISPEQTGRMNRGIDYRSDFYSLGVTFYELLTGELPFNSDDVMELVHCHIAKKPPVLKNLHLNSLIDKKPDVNPLVDKKPHPNPLLGKERGLEIPQVISDIVMKLMAKNAEDRYQSALGLKYDLEICLQQLKETGKIENFPIAERDKNDRFIIPEKLYGRETEVEELLAAFKRVSGITSDSPSELMLVAGFSGIGKTALINEVHKPIVKQRGYFIKGKFDQFNRNIPLSAFVQAFRDLIAQLLGESDAQLSIWKTKILQALGDNAQVIVDVIPELEKIIGEQPPVAELSGNAAENRFNLLFQKFLQVFTTKEHPLVIFLDDLQWADSASLKLIQLLMSESETNYLLLIGAYRDNEVFPAHPLILTLEDISKTQGIINTITLAPLTEENFNKLVADTLHCSLSIAKPLTHLIYQKTFGNPFFSTQFLKALYEDGLIKFDFDNGSWICDISQVKSLAITDDVVELMAHQIQKLPDSTQEILKLAACVGNQFDLDTLAVISQQSQIETAAALWRALQEEIILPQNEVYKFYLGEEQPLNQTQDSQVVNYKFLHDRVQQAAYSLIPEAEKQATHYRIGKLLLQKIPIEIRQDRIFELVNQLNYGTSLITEQKERTQLAKLNLIACGKAKSAIAYQAGREYANIGLSLLGENAWASQYNLTLAFHDLAVELASLCGDFEIMEDLIEEVIANAHSKLEQVNVYRIRILSLVSQNKLTSAIAIAQQFLQKLGVTFPQKPTQKDAQQAIAVINELMADRKIEDLVNLPLMTDEEKIAIVQINNSIMPVVFISNPLLFPLVVCSSIKLSIEYGNTSASAYAYSCYSMIAFNLQQDVDKGVEFGNLALQVASKLNAKTAKPEVFSTVGLFILHRKYHIQKTLPILQEGYKIALEVGNQDMAGYNILNFCLNSFWCAKSLVTLEQEIHCYCLQLLQFNQLTLANWCRIYWQSTLNLLGIAQHPNILSGEALQETEFLPQLIEAHDFFGLYFLYLYKLMLCYLFGEIELASLHRVEIRQYLIAAPGTVGEPGFYFYDSLTALATLTEESPQTAEILQSVEENQTKLQQQWADYAPMNHQHKVDLVEAEKCRILGQKLEAIELYEKAILGAKTNKYIQEEALANELAAKFYLGWGKEKIAISYMQEAYYCYARWGAKAKTDDLEKRYPQLLAPILQNQFHKLGTTQTRSQSFYKSESLNQTIYQTTLAISGNIDESLDFASILKSSQTLSSEIQLEVLISKLMQVVMENAGASKAALLLQKEDTLILEALTTNNKDIQLLNIPSQDSENIPHTIVNLVKRNLKTVVLDDATTENDFIGDSYLIQQKPKSILCMPILNQGKLIGFLYLENQLTSSAFTQKRVEILNILITQAAISLENAQLYEKLSNYSQTLEEKVEERTLQFKEKAHQLESTLKQLQSTQSQLIQSEKMYALGKLVAGIAHEINNPISFIYGNLTPIEEYIQSFIELFNLYQQNYPQPLPEIESTIEDLDLEFIIDDLPKLLSSMKTGAQRIREIVFSLRNFSRLDEAEIKSVDINSGIDSTLLILQHQLKSNHKYPEIQVIKEYTPLPKVTCYASQLNQVFMNIIGNAIDALRDKQEHQPRITIRTSQLDSQNILISIADNGIGISQLVSNKIFDPFFTTKPVGSGTGLGLSTSYSIVVEKHRGKLSCVSTPGEGTEFLIQLPLCH